MWPTTAQAHVCGENFGSSARFCAELHLANNRDSEIDSDWDGEKTFF